VFVECEYCGLVEAGQGTVDGGGGTGVGQTEKIPKTPRLHNVKGNQFLHLVGAKPLQ
jgi:hypothetical protein